MPITGLQIKNKPEVSMLYNGDVKLEFNPGGHRYTIYIKGVKQFATCGVTTVIGILDKPALVQWSSNMCSDAWIEGLNNADKIDELTIATLAKTAKLAWRVRRDTAGDIGTLIHAWIENYINAKINTTQTPLPPENEMMNAAILKFLLWEKENNITFTGAELKLYSLKHNIAGTCDFTYVTRDGKLGIGDIKTSKGIYDTFYYQVAAYRYMMEEERSYTTGTTPIPYEEMTILRVGKDDGEIQIKEVPNYKDYAKGFLACSYLYRLTNKNKKNY